MNQSRIHMLIYNLRPGLIDLYGEFQFYCFDSLAQRFSVTTMTYAAPNSRQKLNASNCVFSRVQNRVERHLILDFQQV